MCCTTIHFLFGMYSHLLLIFVLFKLSVFKNIYNIELRYQSLILHTMHYATIGSNISIKFFFEHHQLFVKSRAFGFIATISSALLPPFLLVSSPLFFCLQRHHSFCCITALTWYYDHYYFTPHLLSSSTFQQSVKLVSYISDATQRIL